MEILKENRAEIEKSNVLKWIEAGYDGSSATVLVLDDEGDKHENWQDDLIFDDLIPEREGDEDDQIGHATNVAKVIRTFIPKARIIIANNFGKRSSRDNILQWIREHHEEIDVINVSYSSYKADYWEEINDLGITIVASNGNQDKDNYTAYPSRYNFSISVAAFSEGINGIAVYSNDWEDTDCAGFTNVYVWNSRHDKTFGFTGTSCSAPYVSALLAIYSDFKRKNSLPKITPKEAKEFIKENAIDVMREGFDYSSGWGLFVLPELIPEIIKEVDEVKFTDVLETRWSANDIDLVSDYGIMNGFPDGTFKPMQSLTREEFASAIAKMIKQGYIKK